MIEESSGVRKEDRGRTVWIWDEAQTSESSERAQEKRSSIIVRRPKALLFECPPIRLVFRPPMEYREYMRRRTSPIVLSCSPLAGM
jgi:hypothetical protein